MQIYSMHTPHHHHQVSDSWLPSLSPWHASLWFCVSVPFLQCLYTFQSTMLPSVLYTLCQISLSISLYASVPLRFFLSGIFEEFRWSSRIFVLLYLSLGELSLQLAPYLVSVSAMYALLLLDMSLKLICFLIAECFILVSHFYCILYLVFVMFYRFNSIWWCICFLLSSEQTL